MKIQFLRLTLLSLLTLLCSTVSAKEVTMAYTGTTTTNMTGENDAALMGLDATAWSVIGDKGANSNLPGLNKAGDLRLYGPSSDGNTVTVESLSGETINSIHISFTGAQYSNVSVTVDGQAVTGTDGNYTIGAKKFVLGNANDDKTQVRIKSIIIDYGTGETTHPTYTSLKDIQAEAKSASTPVIIKFDGQQVVFVSGSNAYIADSEGYGLLVYTKNHGLEVGEKLTGEMECYLTLYQGNAEITDFKKDALTTSNGDVAAAEKKIADISKANQSTLVTLKGVTYQAGEGDKLLTDGSNSIVYYDKFKTSAALEDGKKYDVTGMVVMYNDKIEICPRTADDVVEATAGPVAEPMVLTWDYSEAAPKGSPDNGLYYAASVNDGAGTNNGLKGIKLNSSGYAFFAKPAVAGKLTLVIGPRSGVKDFSVDVLACTIADGNATQGDLIATSDVVTESNAVVIDIPAEVTGIYIKRKLAVEGVLSKVVFKETVARTFVDFEITNDQLKGVFDASTLPAGVTFSGTQRNDSHGYGKVTITVPVDGTVKFTIGGCQYANPATCKVTNAAGELLAEPNLKTATCYHQDGAAATYFYVGEPTVLTFSDIAYLPYFKAEAAEVQEATVTYKDQNGKTLGTKKVYEGDAIGDVPFSEADLTIGQGEKFRGWFYANETKVKASDAVNGNISISAKVTPIESVSVGSIQTYDLTKATFYPEDHETITTTGGAYYNNHGWNFAAEGSFTVDVAGKAQVLLALCQYGNGTTITVTDAKGNVIKNDVPAIAETDGGITVVNYDGEATQLTFTFAAQSYLHRIEVYNVQNFLAKDEQSGYYIVPKDDAASLILAINNASAEEGAKIFLQNGTYDLGEKVMTAISGKNVSLIGQSADKTIVVTTPPLAIEGLGKADLLNNTGEGLYMQDLTLKNDMYYDANTTGRACTLHDQGTKTICKNVNHLSHQDTYYSHKVGGLYYFEGGELHGTVDFLCGNGRAYFNNATIVTEKRSTTTISANSELYVFNGCTVKTFADSYNLGRAWSDNPVCIYLNTTLEDPSKLIATRWNLKGINCDYSIAGEYGTKDAQGNNITPASNTVTFTLQNTTLNTILSADEAATYTIDYVLGDWAQTAQQEAKQLEAPADAKYDNGTVTWTPANNGATAYLIEKNGEFVAITTQPTYNITVDAAKDALTIRAANGRGGFGPAAAVAGTVNAVSAVKADGQQDDAIYNLQGVRVSKAGKGVYIIGGKKVIK